MIVVGYIIHLYFTKINFLKFTKFKKVLFKIVDTIDKNHQWKAIGFKGLWKECVYTPRLLLSMTSDSTAKSITTDEILNSVSAKLNLPKKSSLSEKKLIEIRCTILTFENSSCLLLVSRLHLKI